MSRGKNKTKYSESERSRILDELKNSVLSFTDFAKQHGVPSSTLHGWQQRSQKKLSQKPKLYQPTKTEATSAFLPVRISEPQKLQTKIDSKWLAEFLFTLAERGVL